MNKKYQPKENNIFWEYVRDNFYDKYLVQGITSFEKLENIFTEELYTLGKSKNMANDKIYSDINHYGKKCLLYWYNKAVGKKRPLGKYKV